MGRNVRSGCCKMRRIWAQVIDLKLVRFALASIASASHCSHPA